MDFSPPLAERSERKETPRVTLTKGQQRACRLGDVALASLLPPRVRVPECQAEWLPITPWSVCTLPDWMEWRRAP